MSGNQIADGREIPMEMAMDTEGLQAALAAGPPAPESEVKPEIPPLPEAPQEASGPVAADVKRTSVAGEGPDEDTMKLMILPSEKEKRILKEKFGSDLRVVPLPYSRTDGKADTYVLRRLTRAQWRAMEDAANKVAEVKPGVQADEIFQEKIVALAVVWPGVEEYKMQALPAGLVPTLFGIVQQMGLFFNPEVLMAGTFAL